MTSILDTYYRRIIQNIDNVRMKFDISSLLVKSKEYDSKINTIVSYISSNLSLINTNKSNITHNYDISQINKKISEFNTSLCDTNRNNIASNLLLINEINNFYKIRHFIKFETVNNINRAISINSPKFSIIKNDIVFDFKKGSYIECHLSILIRFILHYINIQFFHILLEYFDDQNNLFKSIKMGLVGQISKLCILNNYCVTMIPNDYKKIYFELSIVLNDDINKSDIIKITDFDNHIYFKILKNN